MLEHYLNLDFPTIDKLYQQYVRRVAFAEYSAQWESATFSCGWRSGAHTIPACCMSSHGSSA